MTFNLTEVKEFILSIFIFHVVTGPISALHNYKNQKRNRVKFLNHQIGFFCNINRSRVFNFFYYNDKKTLKESRKHKFGEYGFHRYVFVFVSVSMICGYDTWSRTIK